MANHQLRTPRCAWRGLLLLDNPLRQQGRSTTDSAKKKKKKQQTAISNTVKA
jgi:hypothetical protein